MTTHYIRLSDGYFPMHEGDIRLAHPEIREDQTHPNFPCPEGYALVEMEPMPEFDIDTHTVDRLPPEKVNGKWRVRWSNIREHSPEVVEARQKIKEDFLKEMQGNSIYRNLDAPGGVPNVFG